MVDNRYYRKQQRWMAPIVILTKKTLPWSAQLLSCLLLAVAGQNFGVKSSAQRYIHWGDLQVTYHGHNQQSQRCQCWWWRGCGEPGAGGRGGHHGQGDLHTAPVQVQHLEVTSSIIIIHKYSKKLLLFKDTWFDVC